MDREAAQKEVVQVIATAPEKSEQKARAYNLYGMILDEDKKFDKAIDMFNKSLSINRRAPYVFLNLGNALYQKGERDEAIKNLRKAIELDSTFAPAYSNLGTFLHVLHVDSAEAIKNLRKAIELNPKDASTYNSLGNVLNDLGQRDEAIQNYRKAIELDPKDAFAYNGLGNVLRVKGQRDDAMKKLRKAIELDPKHAPAYYNLGLALEETAESLRRAGKPNEAEDKLAEACIFFHQASILTPDNQSYRLRRDRINSLLPSEKKCVRE